MFLDLKDSKTFVIDETKKGDDGIYIVKVYSQLGNYYNMKLSTMFKVTIKPDYDFIIELPPIWKPKLIDQRVKKGEDLSYPPEIEVLENGYEYTLKVRMNQVALFGSYD